MNNNDPEDIQAVVACNWAHFLRYGVLSALQTQQ